jgi:hypothetical protein
VALLADNRIADLDQSRDRRRGDRIPRLPSTAGRVGSKACSRRDCWPLSPQPQRQHLSTDPARGLSRWRWRSSIACRLIWSWGTKLASPGSADLAHAQNPAPDTRQFPHFSLRCADRDTRRAVPGRSARPKPGSRPSRRHAAHPPSGSPRGVSPLQREWMDLCYMTGASRRRLRTPSNGQKWSAGPSLVAKPERSHAVAARRVSTWRPIRVRQNGKTDFAPPAPRCHSDAASVTNRTSPRLLPRYRSSSTGRLGRSPLASNGKKSTRKLSQSGAEPDICQSRRAGMRNP